MTTFFKYIFQPHHQNLQCSLHKMHAFPIDTIKISALFKNFFLHLKHGDKKLH